MWVSEFLISTWSHSVFLILDEKGPIFITIHEEQKRKPHWCTDSDVTKHPVNIMVFGMVTSNGDVMPPFFFAHGLRLNTEAYIKCLEEVVLPWIKRQKNCAILHKQKNLSLGCQKISVTTSSLTSGRLTPLTAIFFIMCGLQLSERPTKLCAT